MIDHRCPQIFTGAGATRGFSERIRVLTTSGSPTGRGRSSLGSVRGGGATGCAVAIASEAVLGVSVMMSSPDWCLWFLILGAVGRDEGRSLCVRPSGLPVDSDASRLERLESEST